MDPPGKHIEDFTMAPNALPQPDALIPVPVPPPPVAALSLPPTQAAARTVPPDPTVAMRRGMPSSYAHGKDAHMEVDYGFEEDTTVEDNRKPAAVGGGRRDANVDVQVDVIAVPLEEDGETTDSEEYEDAHPVDKDEQPEAMTVQVTPRARGKLELTLADSAAPCPKGSETNAHGHSPPTNIRIFTLASQGPTTFGCEELVECLSFKEAFLSTLSECDESGIQTNVTGTGSSRLINCPLSRQFMNSLLTWYEPHIGADFLTRLTLSHNEVPRTANCKELLDALTQGPQCRKKILYPDCARMEHVKEYRNVLLQSKPQMCHEFANLQPYSWWAKVVDVVSQPSGVYCAEGDENRITSAALLRVGQSLFVKHCGMETLEMILRYQLDSFCLKQGTTPRATKSNAELSLSTFGIFNTLFSDEGGTLNALTQLARATILNWIHYGHYQSAYFYFPQTEEANEPASTSGCHKQVPPRATVTDVQFVSSAFRELYLVLGKLVSYMAWLHTVQNKAVRMSDAAFTIAGVVKNELLTTTCNPSQFLTVSTKDHWEDMKLQFCLSLEKVGLGKAVATMLECDLEWFGEVITGEESEVDEKELRAWLDEPVPDDWGL